MRFKTLFTFACCFLGLLLVPGEMDARQQRNAAGERGFPQPAPERDVTVTAIPGVIAAGANWKLVWQGPDNADGIVGTKDGGLLFAQEQPSEVGRLDPNGKFSIFVKDTHGTGDLGIDYNVRLVGAERMCWRSVGDPDYCHYPAGLVL